MGNPVMRQDLQRPRQEEDIDWDDISSRYQEMLSVVSMFRLPTPSEIEHYERGILIGDQSIRGPLEEKHRQGAHLFPGTGPWMSRAVQLADEIHRSHEHQSATPAFLEVLDWQGAIEAAIQSRSVTMRFLEAWWHFGAIFGRTVELDESSEASQTSKRAQINSGKETDNRAREFWYARWLTSRGVYVRKNGCSRGTADSDLVELCSKIRNGELVSPIRPNFFDKRWFSLFAARKKGEEWYLSSGFSRLSREKILELSDSTFFPLELLPPVSQAQFVKRSDP
ncbi:hypothetical protein [Methylobacterium sp. J-092]|uniref:hypothetical protein n=1 Tax=Methylobacterium sp. J-092 TaxID=2836667 RepID=UPI001FB9872A|nr:hypothetical protein [Methylobacterium sp. J-092]MCJ2008392.1 hypothetical protein [Methylobacterium sp. J-092]